jgi:hypothetical protein
MAAPWSKRLWARVALLGGRRVAGRPVACWLSQHDWVNQIGELDDPGRPLFICARCGQVSDRTDSKIDFSAGT